MCQGLEELRKAIATYTVGFDADLISVEDARGVVSAAAAIESSAACLKTLAATRMMRRRDDSRRRGSASPAHDLAASTGTSVGAAQGVLDAGQRLGAQGAVCDAARRGELSAAQVALVTEGAAADPSAEARLMQIAAGSSIAELRAEVGRIKAAAKPDPEAARKDIYDRRGLRGWTDTEGVWNLRARGNPEHGAQIMAALSPIADQAFNAARRDGRREHPDAYAFDALLTLATESTGTDAASTTDAAKAGRRSAPATMYFRVDWDAFLAGAPRDGEVCELVGYGPVAMSVINEALDNANPFVVAILTKAKEVVGVAHLGRRPNAHQQSALRWLYPCCAARGCVQSIRLESDHRIDWARTKFTVFDLMDRLCRFHHSLKTREGWALVKGTGKRDFVSPEDPRHPRHKRRAA